MIRKMRRELLNTGYRLNKLRKPQWFQERGWAEYLVWDMELGVPVLWAEGLDEVIEWIGEA